MLRSAGCVYVQSAAQLRHVPRHQHAQDVLGEQLPVLCPPDLQSRPLSRTLLARWSRFAAHRPASQPAQSPHTLCALLATLGSQDAKKFSQQLRFDLSSVPNTGEMFHVCTPPRPAPPICAAARTLLLHAARTPRSRWCIPAGGGSCTRSLRPRRFHALVFRIGRGPRVVGSSENRNRQDVPIATLCV